MGVEEFNFPGKNASSPDHPMSVRPSDGTAFQGGVDNPLAVRLSDGEQYGPIQVGGIGSFGDVVTAELQPQVQMDFVYGSNVDTQEQDSASGGAVTFDESMASCSSGSTPGGSAQMETKASARYRPGQGLVIRQSGLFSTASIGARQLLGGNSFGENGLFFGVNEVTGLFGVCRMHGGFREIQILTISAASTGVETGTVTLDGSATTVPMTSGTAEETAQEVAEGTYPGWQAFAAEGKVYFMADAAEDKVGAFTFASTGTAEGAIVEKLAGVVPTFSWTAQADWNTDTMLPDESDPLIGAGPSKQVLDITKLNVYIVQLQYLGGGPMEFFVTNSSTGRPQRVHRIGYANSEITPSIGNPTMRTHVSVLNFAGVSGVAVKSASMAIFTEGAARVLGHHHGADVDTNISARVPVLSIRNNVAFVDGTARLNVRDMLPHLVSVATNGGSKPMKFSLILGGTLTDPLWEFYDAQHSPVVVDVSATGITGGDDILPGGLPKDGGHAESLIAHAIRLLPGEVLSVVMEPTGSAADVTAGLVWREDT